MHLKHSKVQLKVWSPPRVKRKKQIYGLLEMYFLLIFSSFKHFKPVSTVEWTYSGRALLRFDEGGVSRTF